MKKEIGFIGLGNMGFPMAQRLLQHFHSLHIHNRSQARCLELVAQGAQNHIELIELAHTVDLCFLSLPGPKEVEALMPEILEHGKAGQVIVDFSTISVQQSQSLAAQAKSLGKTYIDMPVSGGPKGAALGSLSIMIGASESEIQSLALYPYLEVLGSSLHYMGDRGRGSAIKIINNFMAFSTQVINSEAFCLALENGIDPQQFFEVVQNSSGNNMILGAKKDKWLKQDYSASFTLDLCVKDLNLAKDLFGSSDPSNLSLSHTLQQYQEAQSQGMGALDSCSVVEIIKKKV